MNGILLLAVTLLWNPSPTPDVSYRLKYGTQPGIYTAVQDAGASTQADVDGLSPGTYYFAAFAYLGALESEPSNEVQYVQAAPSDFADTQITDLRVVSGSLSGGITLTWTKPAEAVNHAVYWDNDTPTEPLPFRKNDATPPTSGPPTYTMDENEVYYFEVRAINSAGVMNRASNRVHWPADPAPTPTPTPTPTPAPSPTPLVVRSLLVKTKHQPGDQIVIKALPVLAGKTFKIWTGDISILANPMLNETTATIPSSIDPTVEATYNE